MRLIHTLLASLLCLMGTAQLEFVGSYDVSARLIYLSDNEPAIMLYDQQNEHIDLYNTDLSLIASFDIPVEYVGSGQYNLYHVSRTLFDCDTTNIEYLISYGGSLAQSYVQVIRDDESILFDLPEHTFADDNSISTVPPLGPAMVEDENGVVFAFVNSGSPLGPVTLYRSCGSIPGCCSPCLSDSLGVGLEEHDLHGLHFNLYPNPSNGQFAIDYDLPVSYSSAFLSLYDMNGKEVLSKRVGPRMDHILVNTSSLASGRYQVILRTESGILLSTSYIELD